MAKAEESLFLLEILIDKIVFLKIPCFSEKSFKTCASFQFLNLAPLVICDDDRAYAVTLEPNTKEFNCGKSCLFPLTQGEITKAISGLPIKVEVYKALPCDCLPTKITLGTCTIELKKEFAEAHKNFLAKPDNVCYDSLKDTFKLKASDNSESAELILFARISCFGKNIITQFQGSGGAEETPFDQYDVNKEKPLRPCPPKKKYRGMAEPCYCGASKSQGLPCEIICPTDEFAPCMDNDDPCPCDGPPRGMPADCKHPAGPLPDPKGACCPVGNRIVFQSPADSCAAGHRNTSHLKYTSEGVGDLSREDPTDMKAPSRTGKPPAVVCDFGDQVIKLKIHKTVEMPGRKTNFELQFFTPKPGDRETLIPGTDTREIQCDPTGKAKKKKAKCAPKAMCEF